MNALESYQCDAVERPLIRRRLFWALVVSLILHAGIVIWFRQTHLARFNAPVERLVPRIFNVKNITINEGAIQADNQAASKKPEPTPAKALDIPDDKPMADVTEGKMTPSAPPAAPDLVKPMTLEKPAVTANDVQAIARAQESERKVIEQDLSSLNESLLKDQTASASHPMIKLPDSPGANAEQSDAAGMAAASDRLNRLLGRGLRAGDAPVTMPGGAMFEFDSSTVQPAAIDQLRKLGLLIRQSPNATFSIEGYTDSFGDAAYNVQLSQDRADAVRTWLVQNMDADPSHIQATGFGATHFIVAPKPVDMHSQASIDQEKLLEQPNRRVEIRFKFPKGQ